MASLNLTTQLRNNETRQSLDVRSNLTQANNFVDAGQINVAITETTHTISSSLTAPGAFVFINRDPDNYVDIGIVTGAYFLRLFPGQSCQGHLIPTATQIFLLANTAPVRVQFEIYDA